MKNISVFCGAHEGNNPRYAEDAKKIEKFLQQKASMLFLVVEM